MVNGASSCSDAIRKRWSNAQAGSVMENGLLPGISPPFRWTGCQGYNTPEAEIKHHCIDARRHLSA